MLTTPEDDEAATVKMWFDKNNLLVRGIFSHFAGRLTKTVDPNDIRISVAELLKFCQSIKVEDRVGLSAVAT